MVQNPSEESLCYKIIEREFSVRKGIDKEIILREKSMKGVLGDESCLEREVR